MTFEEQKFGNQDLTRMYLKSGGGFRLETDRILVFVAKSNASSIHWVPFEVEKNFLAGSLSTANRVNTAAFIRSKAF